MEEFQTDPNAPFGYVGLAFPSAKDDQGTGVLQQARLKLPEPKKLI